MNDRLVGRAAFLGIVGAGVAGIFFGKDAVRALRSAVPNTVEALVPTAGWRIYTIGDRMPAIDPAAWRLRVDGHVETPLTLSLADVKGLPRAEQVSDFHCVTGWSVNDVRWAGVRFQDLLAAAGTLPGAGAIRFVSDEVPYEDSLTLEQALLPDVLLAYAMDGAPLSRPHGAPARLVIPRMYGYKSVKWVTRIELVPRAEPGYWERRGYDANAWVGRSNGLGPSA
jgi:DMSO/TMAO reductase YedYZ molybdopterin-dependent catalytic subunit